MYAYDTVTDAGKMNDVIKYSVGSGLAFYIYNEASFNVLGQVGT
jgi:hypothetical protein